MLQVCDASLFRSLCSVLFQVERVRRMHGYVEKSGSVSVSADDLNDG